MPSLRKRHSWPPMQMRQLFHINESNDENPSAHFISPANNGDYYFEIDMAAGICSDRETRSLSPTYLKPWSSKKNKAKLPTSKFKRWIERMEKQYFHRVAPVCNSSSPEHSKGLEPELSPLRGRGDVRTTSAQRITHHTKSLPRRSRVWRAPSSDIWPVMEELEQNGLGIKL